MNKSVQLPVCTPVFSTFQTHSSAGMAMARNPESYNQVLNQCVTLSCTRRFLRGDFSSPETGIPNATLFNFPALERYPVTMYFVAPFIHSVIKKMLDEEFYVHYFDVDDFYLPGKSWYGIRHMIHDGTITGYDDNDMTYTIVAFDINWVYRAIRVPQEAFQTGLESAIAEKKYGAMNGLRVRPGAVALDLRKITNGLKDYLNSDFTRYPTEVNGGVAGTVVHDYMILYLQKLQDGSILHEKMDWRSFRPIWEHKKCMLDRIEAVEKKLELDSSLSDAYRPLVDETDRLRMLYALYQKKKKDNIPPMIIKGLTSVKEQETAILKSLIEKMEGALQK